jgi:hypothetical protein
MSRYEVIECISADRKVTVCVWDWKTRRHHGYNLSMSRTSYGTHRASYTRFDYQNIANWLNEREAGYPAQVRLEHLYRSQREARLSKARIRPGSASKPRRPKS